MTKLNYFSTATVLLTAITFAAPAEARHRTPLECAANEYREAVLEFERAVFRSKNFARFQERLADDLEVASGRLRSAAPTRFVEFDAAMARDSSAAHARRAIDSWRSPLS